MASGAAASQVAASALAVAVSLLRTRWREAKTGSNADPEAVASAEFLLFRSLDVALDALGVQGAAGSISGASSVAAEFVAVDGESGVVAHVEDVATPSLFRCDYLRDSRGSDSAEAWNTLLYLSNVEKEVLELFRKHGEIASAAYAPSSAPPCVWLFVDFEMFYKGTGFEFVQASALWHRWMRIVPGDRIWGGCKIAVAFQELLRD